MNSEGFAGIGMVICVTLLGGALTWWFVCVGGWIWEILNVLRDIRYDLEELRRGMFLNIDKDK